MATIDTERPPIIGTLHEEQVLQDMVTRLEKLEKAAKKCCKSQPDQIKVHCEDKDCFPTPDGAHGFDLKFDSNSQEPTIPPRMAFPLQCGWTVEMPKGMQLAVQVTDEWAQKGLILTVNTYDHEPVSRRAVSVMAYNVGRQILAFQHGQVIGKIWFVKADQVALVSCK